MPAKSQAQQRLMAMALHNPKKLYARNRGVANMDKGDLEEFASTKRKGLPSYADNVKQAVRRKKR